MPNIKVKSCDDQVFDVDVKVAQCSVKIKTMLEDLGMSKGVIALPNVNGSVLKKVLEWANYHKYDPPVNDDENPAKRKDDICEWDMEFLRVDQETLLGLAANYLGIKGLLGVPRKTVANIKGKIPGKNRKTLNIKN